MSLYSNIIDKILEEVDPDIRELMQSSDGKYKAVEMLGENAALTILTWQTLRDRKKDDIIITHEPTIDRPQSDRD